MVIATIFFVLLLWAGVHWLPATLLSLAVGVVESSCHYWRLKYEAKCRESDQLEMVKLLKEAEIARSKRAS